MSDSRFHGVFSSLLREKAGSSLPDDMAPFTDEEAGAFADAAPSGQIAVDVYEDGGYIVIKAPIAGVKLADLDIDVSDDVITIRGKRDQCDDLSEGDYILQECYWGEFSRSVTLPHTINPAKVRATFSKDNILKIFVPKEEKRVKIIKINEGG
jgi:HSP20 family protein